MITQTTNLNLIPYGPPIVVHCDQYDEGTGRLIFNLYENDIAYTPTGTAVIQGTKPDNHGFNYNCTMVGNVVTADLTDQMTPVAGSVRCQIVVTESDGRTGSFAFILEVQKSALPDDTVLSDSDFQLIQQAIQDTAESAEDAEAWAVGERNGVPVTSGDETYHNNAKYWAAQSQVGSLDTLTDVTITAPTDGQVLTYDANSAEWINGSSSGASSLNTLTDVNITTVSDGQALRYDSNSGKWINEAVSDDITNLGGVTISAPTDGQSLVYDSNSGEWINQNVTATTTLSNLTDVSLSTLTDGEVLTYDSIGGKWQNEALTMALPSLSDVNISSPTDDQVLTYDANLNGWKNKSFSGGGGMNTDGSNAAASVGMVSTKQFLVGDRTNKGTAGTYAYEIGDGAEATGYGAYAEGALNYSATSLNVALSANITTETLRITQSLTAYPYQSYSLSGSCQYPSNWEATIAQTLDSDITLTSGDVTVRITKDGTNIKVYYTNTGNTSKTLYYGYATGINEASGNFSHAEGSNANASGNSSHAEGSNTVASGNSSHAEGGNTDATGGNSHAEGSVTLASAFNSHAEGYATQASGTASHAEGQVCIASGAASHAEGYYTRASSDYQHTSGKYNVEDSNDTYAVIVGNGTANNARSNAFTVDWSGNACDGTGNKLVNTAEITNPNLLDNPWFTVNQRGQSSYTSIGYTVDRWKGGSANSVVTVNSDNSVTLSKTTTGNTYLVQYFEDDVVQRLAGKTITLSINVTAVTGNLIKIRLRCGDASDTYLKSIMISGLTTGLSYITDDIPSNTKKIRCEIYDDTTTQGASESITVESVKLEIGSISTLALDTAPNYATELLKCKRYFQRLSGDLLRTNTYTANIMFFRYPLQVEMRTSPTVTGEPVVKNMQGISQTGFAFTYGGVNYNQALNIQANKTSHGLTDGYINCGTNGLFLSADL